MGLGDSNCRPRFRANLLLATVRLWALLVQARAFPELAGRFNRIDADFLPPSLLIAHAMHESMMNATERDHELVAGLAPERPRLREAQVVRIRGLAATDEARLLGHVSQVFTVAVATRDRDCEYALVDASSWTVNGAFAGLLRSSNLLWRGLAVRSDFP